MAFAYDWLIVIFEPDCDFQRELHNQHDMIILNSSNSFVYDITLFNFVSFHFQHPITVQYQMKTALIYTLLISFTCFTFITSQIVSHSIPNSKEYEKEVLKYWTPERMRNAIPVDFPTTRRFYSIYNVTEYVPAPEYSQMPYKAIGKIYFTRAGMNYVCSGVANGNCTVITAGHCVSDGQGHYHSNWIFKPGTLFVILITQL